MSSPLHALRAARKRRAADCLERIPYDDCSLDALPDALRVAMAQHWAQRARSEMRVGRAFSAMLPRLRAIGAAPLVLSLLEISADDERVHAEICRRLSASYAGTELAAEAAECDVKLPEFGCDDERLEMALVVAGMCCVNETIATAWIEANLAASTAPIAIAANRVHLRDEIDHARLGWAHLASSALDDELREALADCVPRLLAANLPGWLRPDAFTPATGVPGHGQREQGAVEQSILQTVHEVVLPGFAYVGLRIAPFRLELARSRAVQWEKAK